MDATATNESWNPTSKSHKGLTKSIQKAVFFRKAGRTRFPSLLRFRSQSESQRTASPAPAYKQVHLQAAPSPKKKPQNARSRRLPGDRMIRRYPVNGRRQRDTIFPNLLNVQRIIYRAVLVLCLTSEKAADL